MNLSPVIKASSSQIFSINFSHKRLFLPVLLIALLFMTSTRELVLNVLTEAFLQVTVFVAATLALYYWLSDKFPQFDLASIAKKYPKWEVCFAALLGALPGCGGAIIVVTQFTKGKASFGSVVAVLTATMGDAAFLLLSQKPLDALVILLISLLVGSISGYLVNKVHNKDYLKPTANSLSHDQPAHSNNIINRLSGIFWNLVFFPALVIALLVAFQIDLAATINISEQWTVTFGAAAGLIVIVLWSLNSKGRTYQELTAEDEVEKDKKGVSIWQKVVQDTHFVTAWVVVAFLAFELGMLWFKLDLSNWFANWAALAPLIGMLVGLLPGCGPQIVMTTLYIQGVVPFSSQLSNAISNDGDALFPAIALAPKAAIVATLYSALPALFCGYGYYFLFELS